MPKQKNNTAFKALLQSESCFRSKLEMMSDCYVHQMLISK